MTSQLIFEEINDLNKAFDVETWLRENYGCEFFKSNSGWLNSCCPFEDHKESNPSFGINIEEGFFKCFGCSRQGNFITLVSGLTNLNFYQTINLISEFAGIDLGELSSIQYKFERFKKLLNEENQEYFNNKKIVLKAIHAIKNIQKKDFEEADRLFERLDFLVKEHKYNEILEMINGRIN